MFVWAMALSASMTLAGAPVSEPEIPVTEGKDLPAVSGPLGNTEKLRNLVSPLGNSRFDLQIRRSSRQVGTVPTVAVPPGNVAVAHTIVYPAGWQGYRVVAAPGEKIKARLRGTHQAWFVVRCVNKWGQLEKGMFQNLIYTGNPEASYINPKNEDSTVFFVVDTTEIVQGNEPFTLTFTREKVEPAK